MTFEEMTRRMAAAFPDAIVKPEPSIRTAWAEFPGRRLKIAGAQVEFFHASLLDGAPSVVAKCHRVFGRLIDVESELERRLIEEPRP